MKLSGEMNKSLSENVLRSRLDAALRSLVSGRPMIEGSLSTIRVTCGNPNCRCAKGEKHISHILTSKINKKTKSIYVPTDMVEEVTAWVEEHRRMKKKFKEISALGEQLIKQHVAVRRAVAKNLKLRKATPPT
jgi:hypothetical protein